jgi:hypothetical protein
MAGLILTAAGVTAPAIAVAPHAPLSCVAPANAIVAENCLQGNPASEWDVEGAGDLSIQGFATDSSVNRGETISFKVKTDAAAYHLDIYRIGYYNGDGARKVATVQPSATLPQSQPDCLTDASTGLIDCGNWAVSASWTVPITATSGVYIARPVRDVTLGASHIIFIVRDDDGDSDLLFQTSDTTWQAINNYGGRSLYEGGPGTNPWRAYKVSYNRPLLSSEVYGGQDDFFDAEYPMVRWLERNGYDVSYFSGVDTDRYGSLLLNHKVYMSVGHDEFWSGDQRTNVEAARAAGVHLAFFSGNEIFWKTRYEASIDGTNTPYRTLVSYKETHNGAKIDPEEEWTGTWRDPRFSPPADGGRPENALSGQIYTVNYPSFAIKVPAAEGKLRFWRNTSVANLSPGEVTTLSGNTLGMHWNEPLVNGHQPAGLIRMSSTTEDVSLYLLDYGSTYGPGTGTHALTLYRHSSGALVFGAGTVQWSWGLDGVHDRVASVPDSRMQQATVNLLADMGVQPGSLQNDLVPASVSTDTTAPTSAIALPTDGGSVDVNATIAISGTASDTGGLVGGVEVSVDGGATWYPADGRSSWSYVWTPTTAGSYNIKSRAVDDSGNLETPSAGITLTVGALPSPDVGPGGPIMIVTSMANPFTRYYSEILRAEGFNAFTVTDISKVNPSLLNSYDVVILGEMALTPAQATTFIDWVNAGGNLIAMHPDLDLASLLGITRVGSSTLADKYLKVDTSSGPGVGIVTPTIQFHGTADLYTINNTADPRAVSVATLYSTATTATPNPAVTLRSVGTNGGQAAAFTYDLARSVVYARQGNPAWSGQDRDGDGLIRSDDLFYGDASYDPQPDWIDFDKVAIPQADEQQRLLGNLITQMNLDRKPLPHFWYFPHGHKAVVIMTGDGHPGNWTANRFEGYIAASSPGCSTDNWDCVRGTAYIYPDSADLTNVEAAYYTALGFEIALHVNTGINGGCGGYTETSLNNFFTTQLNQFAAKYTSVPAPATNRTHCVAWSDWATQARVEFSHSIRLDTNYYYWPGSWINDRPGFFTGSGMPMRFAATDGSFIDVYQATTQMTDESEQTYPDTIDTLLDRALGPEGYYGAFTANMHVDSDVSYGSDDIVTSAQARGVPVVSARQMLRWLDGRNGSAFKNLSWAANTLSFTVITGTNTSGLQVMLPITSTVGMLNGVTFNGSPVSVQVQAVKGMVYAVFPAKAGAFSASYGSGKLNQTIAFDPLPNRVYGDPSFTVVATATSTLPVTFTVSGVCTNSGVNGATVALTGAGSCAVTARQAGNTIYNPAPDVVRTFTVTKATPVITWNNPSDIVYGTPLGAAQLNASATTQGTFAYTPVSGTVLSAGTGQPLRVDFTPTDAGNYLTATKTVAITVTKATPVITWTSPSDIVYGTPLGAAQLNATASTAGTFVYTPISGAVLNAGVGQPLRVDFTPTDAGNYLTTTKTVAITVTKATPVITWNNPSDIVYGTPLGEAQLNAMVSVAGSFAYTPISGTVLNAGVGQPLRVDFTPTDAANYLTATKTVAITVTQATPVITWISPSEIVYGTPLGEAQLNATASTAGSFAYTPISGTVLNAGVSQPLRVDFTPTDAANYLTATKTVAITVTKATPVITWTNPADIVYGTPLDEAQLNATASTAGSFAYTPISGTVLNASVGQPLRVDFTPTDAGNYLTATKTVAITVTKATPVITWNNPLDIVYGTPLGAAQLNASATTQGTFAYTPISGTVLNASVGQPLRVDFTPTDAGNYLTVTKTVAITVTKANQAIAFYPLPNKVIGSPSFTVTATATSGLPVTFTVSGACYNSGDNGATMTLTDLGSCTVTAQQSGNSNYNAAPNVSQTFNIVKANQTIVFDPLPDRVIGDPSFVVAATASSGLAVTFMASGDCSITGGTVTLIRAGTCTITAQQLGDANYNAAPDVAQTFAIWATRVFLPLMVMNSP